MSHHGLMTFAFLVFPIVLVWFKKIFLINRGVIQSGGSVSRAVDYFSVSLVIIYDVYFFVFYLD